MNAKNPALKTALAFAVGVGMAFAVGAAEASTMYVRDGDGGNVFGAAGSKALTIGVNTGSGLAQSNVQAGAFYLQHSATNSPYAWTDFVTYCLEPDEFLNLTGIVQGDYRTAISQTAEYSAVASALTSLYATYFADSLTSAVKTAAFQVALWEVAFDNGNNLSAGNFQLMGSSGDTNAVRAQANAYLTNWSTGAEPGVILRVGSQDLLMTAVPEPATLGLFGLGLLGLAAARRRRG